jgi:hypothetical protein
MIQPKTPKQHRAIYGHLDPYAVAPFIDRYGEPLSAEGHRRAWLLHQAIRDGRSLIAVDIRIELVEFVGAEFDGHRYDKALHRQKLCTLLERYDTYDAADSHPTMEVSQEGEAVDRGALCEESRNPEKETGVHADRLSDFEN